MHHELSLIREQMKSDFEFVMKAMVRQRDALGEAVAEQRQALKAALEAMDTALDRQQRAIAEALDEQRQVLADYVGRTDARFGEVIDLVGGHTGRLEDLEERVARLEARQPPAA